MHTLSSISFLEINKIKYNKQKLFYISRRDQQIKRGSKPKDALADSTEMPSARV